MKLTIFFLLFVFIFSISGQTETPPADDLMNVIQDVCWSPDGRVVYFSAMRVKKDYSDFKPEKWGVYRYDLKEKTVVKLVESAFGVTVSPTGRQIAVGKISDGKRDIYILDADGKNVKRLTDDDVEGAAPAWSPDGKRIAFNRQIDKTREVYTINVDGTNLKRLTFNGEHRSYNPNWSPDGKWIAYYLEKGDGKDQVFVIKADGSESKNITGGDEFNNIYPGWIGPDTLIYGQGQKGVPARAFTVKTNGTEKKQLLTLESFFTRISPDGTMIAYIDQKERCIRIVSAKGEALEKIGLF